MAKKLFFAPIVLSGGIDIGGDDNDGDNGSADAPLDALPCTFAYWQSNYEKDYYKDNTIDQLDYCQWWLDNNFTWQQWLKVGNSEEDWKLPTSPADR